MIVRINYVSRTFHMHNVFDFRLALPSRPIHKVDTPFLSRATSITVALGQILTRDISADTCTRDGVLLWGPVFLGGRSFPISYAKAPVWQPIMLEVHL